MTVTDLFILPIGCLVCGLLVASPPLLLKLPALRAAPEALERLRVPIGLATALAGLLALVFPVHGPPVLGSLFPAATGIAIGLLLVLDLLLDVPFLKRYRKALAWVGNALLYVKRPLGALAAVAGILHLIAPQAPFF